MVSKPLRALNAHIQSLPKRTLDSPGDSPTTAEALHLLKAHQVTDLRRLLTHALLQRGLQRFVVEVVAPLNERIGNAWIEGSIQIFQEHLYAEQIQQLLRQAVGSLTQSDQGPRILLTTLPGEQHKLGLLMAEACLAVEGAQCISLGVETPALDIAQAARAHQVDIVGLSFSAAMPVNAARSGLADLRQRLDRKVALWAGGSLWSQARKTMPGVTTLPSLTMMADALNDWRQEHPAQRKT